MLLSEELVSELKELMLSEYKLELTPSEARDLGESLVVVYGAALGTRHIENLAPKSTPLKKKRRKAKKKLALKE